MFKKDAIFQLVLFLGVPLLGMVVLLILYWLGFLPS